MGSVHAVTEEGQMVAASATGSQLASYAAGQPSFIGKILIFEREALPDRGTVIFVREAIGF